MNERSCHLPAVSVREQAKALVLKTYGAARVAGWCGVATDTVYQWLRRGTDREPIPAARVAAIIAGAKAEGLEAPIEILWPAMGEQTQARASHSTESTPADEDWSHRNFMDVEDAP